MFIFNTDLLLLNVGVAQGILVFITASIAILVFTAGTMGWFLVKSRIYESIALCVVAFALFQPGYFMNKVQPPFEAVSPITLEQALGAASDGDSLRLVVSGPDFDTGETKETTLLVSVAGDGDGASRLADTGLLLIIEGEVAKMDEPSFGTPFADKLGSFDFYADDPVVLTSVNAPADQMPKELMFIPALMLLGLIVMLQRGRINKKGEPA
jgi:hypothetical protein